MPEKKRVQYEGSTKSEDLERRAMVKDARAKSKTDQKQPNAYQGVYTVNEYANQPVNEYANALVNEYANQPANQPASEGKYASALVNEYANQPASQPASESKYASQLYNNQDVEQKKPPREDKSPAVYNNQ